MHPLLVGIVLLGLIVLGGLAMRIKYHSHSDCRQGLEQKNGESAALLLRKQAVEVAFSLRKKQATAEECETELLQYTQMYASALESQGLGKKEAYQSLVNLVAIWQAIIEGEFDDIREQGLEHFV